MKQHGNRGALRLDQLPPWDIDDNSARRASEGLPGRTSPDVHARGELGRFRDGAKYEQAQLQCALARVEPRPTCEDGEGLRQWAIV